MDQSTVLIISDDAQFSSAVTGRWQSERTTPTFTLMGGDLCQGLDPEAFEAAIVGPLRAGALAKVFKAIDAAAKPVLLVCDESQTTRGVREKYPRVLVLRQHEGWLDALVLLVSEVMRRCQALENLQRAERANALLQHQAMLGGYMLEMRHNLNNALTSVLGNSELLLLEGASFSPAARAQIETIRDMTLRMHEILQRFSSLEKELKVVAKQAEKESGAKSRPAIAGL